MGFALIQLFSASSTYPGYLSTTSPPRASTPTSKHQLCRKSGIETFTSHWLLSTLYCGGKARLFNYKQLDTAIARNQRSVQEWNHVVVLVLLDRLTIKRRKSKSLHIPSLSEGYVHASPALCLNMESINGPKMSPKPR